jgi:hypothetical protein
VAAVLSGVAGCIITNNSLIANAVLCLLVCCSLLQVDCTAEVDLCRQHFITAFPSIRVFRRAHDDIYIQGHHEHEVRRTQQLLLLQELHDDGTCQDHVAQSPF